ncbi:hypothetical protein [Glaciimonas soli]|uniref:Uncharacterized protein n=1 Tax=Glaciimonas soli TaxID=2590999 RepID=A0A843YQN1_9BURK|nr:hypothetical protein [Glaciimonas soli]MQR01390.1 hypothetical protein [Glaciimonas soli]
MSYLLETYWGWTLLSLVLGCVIGWMTSHTAKHFHWIARWLYAALWVFAAGVIVALLKLLPGRAGLWLETALLFFAAYIIGCLLSAWVKSLLSPAAATSANLVPDSYSAPLPDAIPATNASSVGSRPFGIERPIGTLDNLKLISGVGHKNEEVLHELGIYKFTQIAEWTMPEVHWVEHHFSFPNRVEREDWRGQARELAAGVETEFAKRVKEGKVDSSKD